LSIRPRRHPAA